MVCSSAEYHFPERGANMRRSIAPDALKVVLQHPESLMLLDVRRRADCDVDTVMLPGARWCEPEHISA